MEYVSMARVFPDGLAGEMIPWTARCLAVVVCYVTCADFPKSRRWTVFWSNRERLSTRMPRDFYLKCAQATNLPRLVREVMVDELEVGMRLACGLYWPTRRPSGCRGLSPGEGAIAKIPELQHLRHAAAPVAGLLQIASPFEQAADLRDEVAHANGFRRNAKSDSFSLAISCWSGWPDVRRGMRNRGAFSSILRASWSPPRRGVTMSVEHQIGCGTIRCLRNTGKCHRTVLGLHNTVSKALKHGACKVPDGRVVLHQENGGGLRGFLNRRPFGGGLCFHEHLEEKFPSGSVRWLRLASPRRPSFSSMTEAAVAMLRFFSRVFEILRPDCGAKVRDMRVAAGRQARLTNVACLLDVFLQDLDFQFSTL
jgi:hypothetical protein